MNNFHVTPALPLELIADRYGVTIDGEKVTADMVETGSFVAVMNAVLNKEKIRDEDFYAQSVKFLDKAASDIPFDEAKMLFDRFKELLNDTPDYKLDNTQVITTCPICGGDITEANNAMNGFCVECTRNGLVD